MRAQDAALERIAVRVARSLPSIRSPRRHRITQPVIEVFLLSNQELRSLKRKFLKEKAAFVDVLAFPEPKAFPHPERSGTFLGEIYLNKSLLRGPRRRMLHLLLHGTLHLLGYRHRKKGDTMEMEKTEEKLLAKLLTRA